MRVNESHTHVKVKPSLIVMAILGLYAFLLLGCQNFHIAYKSNVNSNDSQINQSTEVAPDIQ